MALETHGLVRSIAQQADAAPGGWKALRQRLLQLPTTGARPDGGSICC